MSSTRLRLLALPMLGVLTVTSAARADDIQPIPHLVAPLEAGRINTSVSAYFTYTQASFDDVPDEFASTVLLIDGQLALFDLFEIGLTVPVVQHGIDSVGNDRIRDTHFGNLQLNTKLKIFAVAESLGLAVYANGILPTTSSDIDRDFGGLQTGVAATIDLPIVTVGANAGGYLFFQDGPDTNIVEVSAYASASFGLFSFQLQNQYFIFFEPTDQVAVVLTPVASLRLFGTLHIDLASRIALNNEARAITNGGRANLILGAGLDF